MSDNGNAPAGDLRASMLAAAEPIKANLAEVNARIADHESNLVELRKLRTDAERVLKALDPEFESGRSKPGPKQTSGSRKKNVSDEKVDAVLAWLREYAPDRRFSVAAVKAGELGPFGIVPPGTLSFVFTELRERGQIRLDGIGRANRREYRLT